MTCGRELRVDKAQTVQGQGPPDILSMYQAKGKN